MIRKGFSALALVLALTGNAHAQQSDAPTVRPGELIIDPLTLINLGFEWLIAGDANRCEDEAHIEQLSFRPVRVRMVPAP